jgi:hypothetical protein
MAIIIKTLGAATISTQPTTSDLYTAPTNKSALVSSVRLVNQNAAPTDAMNLYVKPSGATARRIHKKDFTLTGNLCLVLDDVVTLGAGDKIQLNIPGPQTPSLSYQINGMERE